MKWPLIIMLFAIACSSNAIASKEALLLNKVFTAIRNDSDNEITEIDYEHISRYISQGKSRWIALYPNLSKSPFLGMTSFQEGLNISMAYALPENPSTVFRFVNESNINAICGLPFIEPTQDEIETYFLSTVRSIGNMLSSGYWEKRCLSHLNTAFIARIPVLNNRIYKVE